MATYEYRCRQGLYPAMQAAVAWVLNARQRIIAVPGVAARGKEPVVYATHHRDTEAIAVQVTNLTAAEAAFVAGYLVAAGRAVDVSKVD